MNVFVTSENPIKCAQHLDDKRLNKMCLETTQLLCTAVNEHGGTTPYKSTHKNHPCSLWTRKTRENWLWLWKHGKALCKEYTKRRGRIHACKSVLDRIEWMFVYIPKGERTSFVNCAANDKLGVSFKHVDDVCKAYQLYLNQRWELDKRPPTWYGVGR